MTVSEIFGEDRIYLFKQNGFGEKIRYLLWDEANNVEIWMSELSFITMCKQAIDDTMIDEKEDVDDK